MARADSIGFFWQDEVKVKPPPKEKVKKIPPFPFWESPDYLPGLEEAKRYRPDYFTDYELGQAAINKERLLFDSEIYPNYCLFAFRSVLSGKAIKFVIDNDCTLGLGEDLGKLQWLLDNFTLITFNGIKFDSIMLAMLFAGYETEKLWEATRMLIEEQMPAKVVYQKFKIKKLAINQIDLIELTALAPGLKKCAGRLRAQKLQDLPIKAGTLLSNDQQTIVEAYCFNDLDNTELLYNNLLPQIELREKMSVRYKVDLRSRSDAQMAEDIVTSEVKRISGKRHIAREKLPANVSYKYKKPTFIKFESPLMNWVLSIVENCNFVVSDDTGEMPLPKELNDLVIKMGKASYQFGLGGLHSQEKSIAHVADNQYFIADTDATSYYPRLILNAGLTPPNLGHEFLLVYDAIITERVKAKFAGDNVVAECLKIVGNGSFGKLFSKWSVLFAPNLGMQVTITGQLSILMLAEAFELQGIEVISINTDGIVVKCLRTRQADFDHIVSQWRDRTGFGTEEIRYKAVYSKDINNYIAIYEQPQKGELFKTKGLYSKTNSKKNCVNEICVTAIKEYMSLGTPFEQTIRNCTDISMFTTMREVRGGGVKGDTYLGKIVRWYYAENEEGVIISALSGNKVARSEGGKPCMDLPKEFPSDVNHNWYIDECNNIMKNIGYC